MSDPAPTNPGVHVPPPALFVVGFLMGLALDRWMFTLRLGGISRTALVIAGWVLIVAGMVLLFWAVLTFVRARTALLPSRPARMIVATGPFRYSRNPMYVGFSAIYIGLSLLMSMAWPLLLLPIVLLSLYALVIRREENYLGHAFGDEYAAYRSRVRRWL
jgi:protein-S-isoprenylcysteine O-methyltransferase Ste14